MALQECLGTTEISGLENEGLEFAGLGNDRPVLCDIQSHATKKLCSSMQANMKDIGLQRYGIIKTVLKRSKLSGEQQKLCNAYGCGSEKNSIVSDCKSSNHCTGSDLANEQMQRNLKYNLHVT